VLFAGDDVTDEDALRSLQPGDVGVRVGPGETAATVRVAGIPELAALLTRLARERTPCGNRLRGCRTAIPPSTSSPAVVSSRTASRRRPPAACCAPSAWATRTGTSPRSASRPAGTRSRRAT
jgi:hypothetical protein